MLSEVQAAQDKAAVARSGKLLGPDVKGRRSIGGHACCQLRLRARLRVRMLGVALALLCSLQLPCEQCTESSSNMSPCSRHLVLRSQRVAGLQAGS